jgi:hypothetical protein
MAYFIVAWVSTMDFFSASHLEILLEATPIDCLDGAWIEIERRLPQIDRQALSDKFQYIKLLNDLTRRLPLEGYDHFPGLLRALIFLSSSPSERFNLPSSTVELATTTDKIWSLLPSFSLSSIVDKLSEFPTQEFVSDSTNIENPNPSSSISESTRWQRSRAGLDLY